MSKASIETDIRDYGEIRGKEEITFTNSDELYKYNETLLKGFITYLNNKHRRTRNVFDCGVKVQIVENSEEFVKEFNDYVMSHLYD